MPDLDLSAGLLEPPRPPRPRRSRAPRDLVHSAAQQLGVSPDIADDYLRLTKIESGHNINVRDSSKGAQGFGQVMPDAPGGTTRTVGGRRYNLRNPEENVAAGLSYFAEGGNDPVARRLYYFGGPRARSTYQRTGRIPSISDGNMTAEQYVRATGGQERRRAAPGIDLSAGLEDAPDLSAGAEQPPPTPPITDALNAIAAPLTRTTRRLQRQQQRGARAELDALTANVNAMTRAMERQAGDTGMGRLRQLDQPAVQAVTGAQQAEFQRLRQGQQMRERQYPGAERANIAHTLKTDEQLKREADTRVSEQMALEGRREEIDAIKARFKNFATGHKGRLVEGTGSFLAGSGVQGGNLLQLVTGGRAGTDLTDKMRLAQVALGELKQEDPSFIAKLERGLPEAAGELAKMTLAGPVLRGATLPALGALSESDRGLQAAARGAAEGELYRRGFQAVAPLPKVAQVVAGVAGPTAVSVAQGQDPTEALIANAAFGGLPLVQGRRSVQRPTESRPTVPEPTQQRLRVGEARQFAETANADLLNAPEVAAGAKPRLRVRHARPAIDGAEVVENRGATLVVEKDGQQHVIKNPRTTGNREAALVREPEPVESSPRTPEVRTPEPPASQPVLDPAPEAVSGAASLPYTGPERRQAGNGPARPATQSVLESALDPQGANVHPIIAGLLKTKHRDSFLMELGEGAVALENSGGAVEFRAANGDIVRLRASYGQGKDATYGNNYDGFIVEREPAAGYTGPERRQIPDKESSRTRDIEVSPSADVTVLEPPVKRTARETITPSSYEAAPQAASQPVQRVRATPETAANPATGQPITPVIYRDPQGREFVEPVGAKRGAKAVPRTVDDIVPLKPAELPASPELPRQPVAAQKSQVDVTRAERGAASLPREMLPKADARLLDDARAANTADPTKPLRLATEVLTKPRALSDTETVQLDIEATRLTNELNRVAKSLDGETDPDTIRARGVEMDALERDLDSLDRAFELSGTEKGRALRSQRIALSEDYSYAGLLRRATRAKERPLTADEKVRYEKQAAEIADLQTKLRDAEVRAAEKRVQRDINRIAKQRKRGETKQKLDEEFTALRQQFSQARAATRLSQPSGLAGLDPEGKLTALVARMAQNRVKAGINSTAKLIDELHAVVQDAGWSKDDVDTVVRNLLGESDTTLSRWDKRRQAQLLKQEADMQARLASGDFTRTPRTAPAYNRETFKLQQRVDEVKARFQREENRAKRGRAGMLIDTAIGAGNLPKTLLSMGDFSALLRQGGWGVATHPVLSGKAAYDMLRSISARGFANVSAEIKANPHFKTARDVMGVEFTGVDKPDAHLSHWEEGYLGSDAIDTISRGKFNPLGYTLKPIKDVSERTFVSFLDSQRMRIAAQFAEGVQSQKSLTRGEQVKALEALGKLVNAGTGRGNLGHRANQIAPALNMVLFSPRLLASRVQLLNKMLNPVAWARMPKGTRITLMKENAKFMGVAVGVLALAKAAGADVNLDYEDSDFLKIKVGNTRYDTLTGLQQPLRFLLNMGAATTADETYTGKDKGTLTADFARTKTSPTAGFLWDYLEGKNRLSGKKFEPATEALKAVLPLPFQDFQEAVKQDGYVKGIAESLPSLAGIGVQVYQGASEKPKTRAEKLARKLARPPGDTARTQEEIDLSREKADLRTRSRRGENVDAELAALPLSEQQKEAVREARGKTRFQEDFHHLDLYEALLVYGVASAAERQSVKAMMQHKTLALDKLAPGKRADAERKMRELGVNEEPRRFTKPRRPGRPTRASIEGQL